MECVVSSLIIVGGVRCFFFNYCGWSASSLIIVGECVVSSLLECVVSLSSLIIVGGVRCFFFNIIGGVRCFFFNYCCWSALFLL